MYYIIAIVGFIGFILWLTEFNLFNWFKTTFIVKFKQNDVLIQITDPKLEPWEVRMLKLNEVMIVEVGNKMYLVQDLDSKIVYSMHKSYAHKNFILSYYSVAKKEISDIIER